MNERMAPFSIIDPDKAVAQEFLSEVNTRIASQPLHYKYGVEARPLESLWEIFGRARGDEEILGLHCFRPRRDENAEPALEAFYSEMAPRL